MSHAIEHLARICNLADWKCVNMAMLTTAIDCSQDKSRKYFTMAALLSSAEEWAIFDQEWRERLAKDGLPYFHMNPFAHATTHPQKPFDKTWIGQEGRRKALMKDLLGIIHSHAWHKFCCILPMNVLDVMSLDSRRYYYPSLIAFAGGLLWTDIERWRLRERFQNQARMVFEQGDEGTGTVIDAFIKATGRTPSFEHKKDIPEKGIVGFTPLQAADILAYEVQKITQLHEKPRPEHFRTPYMELEKIPGDIRLLTEEGAMVQDHVLKVLEYFKGNPLGGGKPQ